MTKNQHYIPQVYLRGFSPEYEKGSKSYPNSRYTIYCYDLNAKKQKYGSVPIKSICYSKYLYEVTGHSGEIVLPNHLEHFFAGIERMFSDFRSGLERKAFIEDNYRTNCFLTNDEKVFWVTYIIIQILRTPQILEIAESLSIETWGDNVSSKQAKNIARKFCLPFFKEIDESSNEAFIINALFEPMKNMLFGVGIGRSKSIITSDKPIYVCGSDFPCEEYDEIIFPVSSELCFFYLEMKIKQNIGKIFCSPLEMKSNKKLSNLWLLLHLENYIRITF